MYETPSVVVLAGCSMQTHLMAGRNTILEEDPTQSRVVAVERGLFSSRGTPMRVFWTKIDETRFRAANKQGLEIMIVVVSDVRVNVGMARNLGLPHQHPQRFFPICCSRVPAIAQELGHKWWCRRHRS